MSVLILVLASSMALTDFWWLTFEQAGKFVYVELVHHQPPTDEDDAPLQDFNNPCFAGIQSISKWRNKYQNTNVHRSLKIWSDNSKREALSGPFVIDIDNECGNLDDALTVTRNAVKCIFKSYNLKESEMRLFFTGHKGFNIEVLPSALGLAGTPSEQDNKANCIREKIISKLQQGTNLGGGYRVGSSKGKTVFIDQNTGKKLSKSNLHLKTVNLVSAGGTIIDIIHGDVRLHNSINEWIECGVNKARKKIELTLRELSNLSLELIVTRSMV